MLIEQHKYTSFENEFRQSLMRGYNRLRLAQGQWVRLDNAELILELLGDFQVLEFRCNHSDSACFTFPFAYLVPWTADLKKPLFRQLEDSNKAILSGPRDTCCSTYRRIRIVPGLEENSSSTLVHNNLGQALKEYLYNERPRPPLLDVLTDPLSRHERFISENWQAIGEIKNATLYRPFDDNGISFPDEVCEVNGVIRLTLPISLEKQEDPAPMLSLILGIAVEDTTKSEVSSGGKAESTSDTKPCETRKCGEICLDCGTTTICRNGMRRLAEILATDVLEYYRRLRELKPLDGEQEPIMLPPVWWPKNAERDPLHAAVDELHRDINRFFVQTGKSPQDFIKGFNFLVAFRELDPSYADSLKYCLSLDNLQTLDSVITNHRSVAEWRKSISSIITNAKDRLRVLLGRHTAPQEAAGRHTRPGAGETVDTKLTRLLEKVDTAIETISAVADSNALKCNLVREIEGNSYPANLTPGYSIMTLGHPEIITDWLQDPRAIGFENYPPGLLAWELSALPGRIYYSALTDGMIPIGVCGVDARLLKDCSPYDLQEIINQKAQRFRYILCQEKLTQFQATMVEGLRGYLSTGVRSDKSAALVFVGALRAFRELAYLFLPTQHDYRTKLVHKPDLDKIDINWTERMNGRSTLWRSANTVSSHAWTKIADLRHLPLNCRDQFGSKENDFIGEFLTEKRGIQFFATLHAITFKLINTTLLFLVPGHHRYHQDVVNELMTHVLSQTESAFTESAAKAAETNTEGGEPPAFISYHRKDQEMVKTLIAVLTAKGAKRFFFDQASIETAALWIPAAFKGIDNSRKALVMYGENSEGKTQKTEVDSIVHRRTHDPNYRSVVVFLPGARGSFEDLRSPLNQWNNIDLREKYDEGVEKLLKFLLDPTLNAAGADSH